MGLTEAESHQIADCKSVRRTGSTSVRLRTRRNELSRYDKADPSGASGASGAERDLSASDPKNDSLSTTYSSRST
ncbi:hypothetical protein BN2475_170062 [Paraburkholderia ribeironis]|uniref:Uncharacterized protein n=1 Tax=Paraburkholderia ribeironis TaxID=1247936 RepID=A0A1N7RVN4_9BURK|nr:hypothetical protein BN2475_170062 [Paraburkholderia ribeironis]